MRELYFKKYYKDNGDEISNAYFRSLKGTIEVEDGFLVPCSELDIYPLISLAKEDFENQGYDIGGVSEDEWEDIWAEFADKLEDYCTGDYHQYWRILQEIAEDKKIPKKN